MKLGQLEELALHGGLGDYLLFAPRDSLISANREGFISLPGEEEQELPIFLILSFFFN